MPDEQEDFILEYKRSTLSDCRTHHLLDGVPMYSKRFDDVLAFHEPGLAPVKMGKSWKFIRPDGSDAFDTKYLRAFGFYENRAGVQSEDGYYHVDEDGNPVYSERFSWCGNFQQDRCTVRNRDMEYYHILSDGSRAYRRNYLYAGDYRDGIAVVRCKDGICRHIDLKGEFINDKKFLDLDVFHKGYALARDNDGWFHVTMEGEEAYSRRFERIEPFYNGQAYCRDLYGNVLIIDENGEDVLKIVSSCEYSSKSNVKILLIGALGVGKTTVSEYVSKELKIPHRSIDDCRELFSDGSFAGEYRAWVKFLEACSSKDSSILEFSGAGPHAYDVREALVASGSKVIVFWIDVPFEICCIRASGRDRTVPLPYMLSNIPDSVKNIQASISDIWDKLWNNKIGVTSHRLNYIENMNIEDIGNEIIVSIGGEKGATV